MQWCIRFLSYGITIWGATYPITPTFLKDQNLYCQAIRAVAKCYYRDEVKTCIHLTILQVNDLLSEIAKFVHCFVTNVLIGNYFLKLLNIPVRDNVTRPT